MSKDELFNDFINFERIYFSSQLLENNFYILLNNSDVSQFIINNLALNHLKSHSIDNMLKKNIKDFSEFFVIKIIDFNLFKYFRCEIDILYAYMLLFLLKIFSFKIKKSKIQLTEVESLSIRDYFLDRNDFINIFSEYLFKFFLYNEIIHNKLFTYNKNLLRLFIFRFIELCVSNGLISLKSFKTSNRHYILLVFNLFSVPFFLETFFYVKKFNVYVRFDSDPFIYNNHFSSVISVTKQATYSNSTFKIPYDQIDALTQRSFFIDRTLLIKNYNFLLEFFSLTNESNLSELFDIYSLKIFNFLCELDICSAKMYHSKLSIILTLIRIKSILDMNFDGKELFLPFMFCFRGRVYDLGNLSFTFYKEFRYCAYSGIYDDELEMFHPINSQINSTIDDYFYLFKKYAWFYNLSLIRKRTCVWLFIALGVLQKNKLGKKVHISAFLLKGFELWESKENIFYDFGIYEKIEFNYILFLIEELKNSKLLKKWIFWKDATASCFQHLLLILGERDDESYSICNLNSTEYWYDPYSYLISDFFEKKKKNATPEDCLLYDNPKYVAIFSRKRLKKVIMTESYGAGFKKLSSYFFLDLDLNELSQEERKKISNLWEDFFNYLINENVLFSQTSKAINNCFKNNKLSVITNPDNTEVDYSCFIVQINQNEFYFNKKRHTYRTKSITSNFDKNQFDVSLRANFVQARDALLARKYIIYTKMWTVHDCFSIDFLNITYMLSVINELMNGEFYDLKINLKKKKPIYSIFIII